MGYYEIMMIVRPDVEANDQEEALSGLTAVISKQGGTVSAVLDWRKRRLSYEINKVREGQYYLIYFSGDGSIISELEHYFRVTDAIIRYMVVAIDERDFEAAAQKAVVDTAVVGVPQEEEVATSEATETAAEGESEAEDLPTKVEPQGPATELENPEE